MKAMCRLNIQRLIKIRDRLNDKINRQIELFLQKLDAVGGFAPTVTKKFGGGRDSIENIAIDNTGDVIVSFSNYFRGDTSFYKIVYPIDLINSLDDKAIRQFAGLNRCK